MLADHYATLGLPPYAEHSAVRAAYLALMQRYHPDRNPSAEAAERARELTAAYEVLGDPDGRADYDLARAQAHPRAAMARRNGSGARRAFLTLAPLAAIALVMLLFFVPRTVSEPDTRTAAASQPSAPRERTAPAVLRRAPMQSKVADSNKPAPVRIAPPPASVEIGRPAVSAEVKRSPPPSVPAPPAPSRTEPQRRVVQRTSVSNGCEAGGPACKDSALAGLDRHLGILFRQSVQRADAAKQGSLYRDHYRFIARLNGCSTDACKQREYLDRMKEVSNTMVAPVKR